MVKEKLIPKLQSIGGRHLIQVIRAVPHSAVSLNTVVATLYESSFNVPAIPGIAIPRFIISNGVNMSRDIRHIKVSAAGVVMFNGAEDLVRMYEGDMLILEREYMVYVPYDALLSIIGAFQPNKDGDNADRDKDKG